MKIAVKNLQNKDVGNIDLPDAIFGADIRGDIMHLMTSFQLNARRAGTQSTKVIGEVSGSGKKPFNQKGGGRARQGSHRSPQMRGGAVVLGPKPRSHATELPKKVRALALKSALSSKAKNGKLIILDEATAKDHKTKPMAAALKALGLESALIVCGKDVDVNFARATSNIPKLDVLPSQGANVYDILRRDVLVLTKDAVNDLTERLS